MCDFSAPTMALVLQMGCGVGIWPPILGERPTAIRIGEQQPPMAGSNLRVNPYAEY